MEPHILFSYFSKSAFSIGFDGVKYTLYSNGHVDVEKGLFEKVLPKKLNPLTKTTEENTNKVEIANKVSAFLTEHEKEISSLPSELSNENILDGGYYEIQFNKKKISGYNFIDMPFKDSKQCESIKLFNKLFHELKKIVPIIH